MSQRLQGKVALVTGAGQGIGRGIAKAFASEGASVAALDVDEVTVTSAARECSERGTRSLALAADVASRPAVDSAVEQTIRELGGIDIVVTCALAKVKMQPLVDTPLSGVEKMWQVGYVGVLNAMQAAFPALQERGGCVINFGSGAGIGAGVGYTSYGPVKEAVRALTRIAAREWGPHGVRVNAICPLAKSDQFDEWAAANPDQAALALDSTALGRIGDCEADIGRAAVFLASDDASYITGHSLMVDGGQGMPL